MGFLILKCRVTIRLGLAMTNLIFEYIRKHIFLTSELPEALTSRILSNNQISEETKMMCVIGNMWSLGIYRDRDSHHKVYTGINAKLAIRFHFRKWKRCVAWSVGEVAYILSSSLPMMFTIPFIRSG